MLIWYKPRNAFIQANFLHSCMEEDIMYKYEHYQIASKETWLWYPNFEYTS